jgi:hypothetical protein
VPLKSLTSTHHLILLGVLVAATFSLRVTALNWGLPPSTPEVAASDIRSSYAFDEDDILTPLSFTQPVRLDLDPRQYQWGTLHLELVLASLQAAERLLYFDHPWREAYYKMLPGDFERVYLAGRMLSVLVSVASVGLMFVLALEYAGAQAAFWASLLVAVSPAHLLASTQIRVDVTMTALLVLAACLGVRAQRGGAPRQFLWLGLAAGASVAAKYPAIFMVIPLIVVVLRPSRFAPALVGAALAGAIAGFLLGEPYMLVRPQGIIRQVSSVLWTSHAIPAAFRIPAADLLRIHAVNAVRFLLGLPAALLAITGLGILVRRRAAADWIPIAMLAGGIASLVPLLWPMLRYQIPLLPLLALPMAVVLDSCPARARILVGAAALVMPLAATVDQLRFMSAPPPANLMLPVVLQQVPQGTPIARLMAELPPLNRRIYPMGPNPLLNDLTLNPPPWVLMTDLPDHRYPETTTNLLRTQYDRVADFSDRPLFAWATLGVSGAPYDWKYTHPRMALFRRRSP